MLVRALSPGPAASFLERSYRIPASYIIVPEPLVGGDYVRLLNIGGKTRYYEIHVPVRARSSNTKLPVVMVFHGGGGFASYMRYQTGMDAISDKEDFITIYMGGSNPVYYDRFLYWNAGATPIDSRQVDINDIFYAQSVLEDIKTMVNIDETRIFACGISNGAHMCFRLVSANKNIKAIGCIAGHRSVGQYSIRPDRKIPLIYFHGTKDTYIPLNGGSINMGYFEPFVSVPVKDMIASWALHNNVIATTKTTVGNATCTIYEDMVQYWELKNGGHTWPGGKISTTEWFGGVGQINKDINASQLIWDFFKTQI